MSAGSKELRDEPEEEFGRSRLVGDLSFWEEKYGTDEPKPKNAPAERSTARLVG